MKKTESAKPRATVSRNELHHFFQRKSEAALSNSTAAREPFISSKNSSAIQPKFKVGSSNDKYEQEADNVADRVMRMSNVNVAQRVESDRIKPVSIQRKCKTCKEELQREEDEGLMSVQRKKTSGDAGDVAPSSVHDVLRSPGQPLENSVRRFMEPRFGRSFDQVRIHTSSQAASSAQSINAKAYTAGSNIVFGANQYNPGSTEGKRLMAHELTHVVQQRASSIGRQGLVRRVATDPVVPVRTQIILTSGVGRSRPNAVANVRLVQDRLLELNYMSAADHAAETPAAAAAGSVPEASLPATITAIELFQSEFQGHAAPDGAIDAGGGSLSGLNRAVPRPTAAEMTAVNTARAGITETVTRGVVIGDPVGHLPNSDVIAGNANRPADVTKVQQRLVELRHLASAHGETPTAPAPAVVIVLTSGVGRGRPNDAADVRLVQNRLLALGHLSAANHGVEFPAVGIVGAIPEASLVATLAAIEAFQSASGFSAPDGAIDTGGTTLGLLNTDSTPSGALTSTKNAIRNFQQREVRYWRGRGEVAGAISNKIIRPADATIALLNRISSYREEFSAAESFSFRDFPRSRHTQHVEGTSVLGTEAPSAMAAAEYTAVGLTPAQTAALRFVSSHEGNFDALNTYDRARVSFGFIQFAGARGLPPFMALLKSRKPATFASMFQTFGIDVEFNTTGGNIANASIVVLDPATNTTLRGVAAEEAIRDSQRLSAVFMRAGHDIEVQRVQIEAATRDYVLPALTRNMSFNADIIEVLSAPGGAVTASHVGAAARAFRATPAFATLNAAFRINERTQASNERTDALLSSERGIGVLIDRNIQEGNTNRIRSAMRWVADREGLTGIAGVSAFEGDVLQQVVDDLTANINITAFLENARRHLLALHTAAGAAAAGVAGVIAMAEASLARGDVDSATSMIPDKSFDSSRTNLESDLPTERLRMNFAPPPASIADLRTLLVSLRAELNSLKPDRGGNSAGFRARVQRVIASTLAAPVAPAAGP